MIQFKLRCLMFTFKKILYYVLNFGFFGILALLTQTQKAMTMMVIGSSSVLCLSIATLLDYDPSKIYTKDGVHIKRIKN